MKLTGHSLGGALALLTQMDLIAAGIPATMINFGQPRVGDKYFANYIAPKFAGSYRVIHWKDMVPHNPGNALGFYHQPTEEFELKDHSLKTCSTTNGEDGTCANSNLIYNVEDHMIYLNFPISVC